MYIHETSEYMLFFSFLSFISFFVFIFVVSFFSGCIYIVQFNNSNVSLAYCKKKPDVVTHSCNPCTKGMRTEESEV